MEKMTIWANQSKRTMQTTLVAISPSFLPAELIKRKPRQHTETLNISTHVASCTLAVYAERFYCFGLNKIILLLLQICVGFNFNSVNMWMAKNLKMEHQLWPILTRGNISIPISSLNVFASYMAYLTKRQPSPNTWTQSPATLEDLQESMISFPPPLKIKHCKNGKSMLPEK